jgi:hypothetical protein
VGFNIQQTDTGALHCTWKPLFFLLAVEVAYTSVMMCIYYANIDVCASFNLLLRTGKTNGLLQFKWTPKPSLLLRLIQKLFWTSIEWTCIMQLNWIERINWNEVNWM